MSFRAWTALSSINPGLVIPTFIPDFGYAFEAGAALAACVPARAKISPIAKTLG
jgi:hypothetical protein